jgi:hypothetical protein
MSYLIQYATRRPQPRRSPRPGVRVDERVTLNLFPEYDGGAHVRVFVEDTSGHRLHRRKLPSPQLKLRITDCMNEIHLEFSVDTAEVRENSLHKIETLIASLERFRDGLRVEAELRAARECGSRARKEIRCRT